MKKEMVFRRIGWYFALVFLVVLTGYFHFIDEPIVIEESTNDETESANTTLTLPWLSCFTENVIFT